MLSKSSNDIVTVAKRKREVCALACASLARQSIIYSTMNNTNVVHFYCAASLTWCLLLVCLRISLDKLSDFTSEQ